MTCITLRFCTDDSATSSLIKLQAGVCVPFTPVHVEALSRDGQHYIGQHLNGGMQARPIGYDKDESGRMDKLVPISCSQDEYNAFQQFCERHLGDVYDWRAIVSYIDLMDNMHTARASICSAIMTLALRAANIFPWPLTVPAHHISPRDLFLIMSTHVEISH
jgi:hypothetical protein